MAKSSSVFCKTKKLKRYIASAYNPLLSLPLSRVCASEYAAVQRRARRCSCVCRICYSGCHSNETDIPMWGLRFSPKREDISQAPVTTRKQCAYSSVISSNKRAAGSLQQSSGSSKSRRVSAPYFQSPSGSDHRFIESFRLENGGKPTSCRI